MANHRETRAVRCKSCEAKYTVFIDYGPPDETKLFRETCKCGAIVCEENCSGMRIDPD